MMNRTFVNSFKVSFTEKANALIYHLKKLPLIGKKIPDNWYRKTKIKLIIGVIGEILNLIKGFFLKALYLGIMIILPAYWITKDIVQVKLYFLHIFFILSFVIASIMKTSVFDKGDESAFHMIRLMRSDAGEYYRSQLLYKRIVEFINFSVPMIILGIFIDISPLKVLVLLLELTAFRFIGEWLYIFVYDTAHKNLGESNVFQGVLVILGLVIAYALPIMKFAINFENILFNIFVESIIVLTGIVAFIYVWNYKRYTILSKELLRKDNIIDFENIKSDMSFGDVKLNEKKISKESLKSKVYDKKKGCEYLNSLFFLRFKTIIVTPIKIRVVIIGIVFLILVCLSVFIPEKSGEIVKMFEERPAMFVFIMYIMSVGQKICKTLFYNCDVKLLRYRYYRSGDVILSNFKARLKRVVALNSIPALVLCLSIASIVIINGYAFKLVNMLPLFLCIICLSCFFSIHYLLLYYVIQPYTAELTVKSTWFHIINSGVYFMSYVCLQIKTSSYYFTLGVIVGTIVYMAVALILIYKLAPKTFKLK